MPIKVANLISDKRRFKLDYQSAEINITYKPSWYTPAMEEQVRQLAEDQFQAGILVKSLAALLIEWDVLDDKGKALKPTEELLKTLPVSFLARVFEAVSEDMRSGEAAKASGAGS